MDFNQFREPFEVWQAAIGNSLPLAERLQSTDTIYQIEREALALLISGELKAPKRKKNVPSPEDRFHEMVQNPRRRKENAAVLYRYIMNQLREQGKSYGNSDRVFEYVAKHDGLEVEQVINEVRRASAPSKKKRESRDRSTRDYCLEIFNKWCHSNWDEVQQFRGRNS